MRSETKAEKEGRRKQTAAPSPEHDGNAVQKWKDSVKRKKRIERRNEYQVSPLHWRTTRESAEVDSLLKPQSLKEAAQFFSAKEQF